MKLAFAGTPQFAAQALRQILAAGHEVVLVLTQPDRPAGRGLKLQPCAVKALALAHGLPVLQPRSLRLDGKYAQDALAAQQALQQAAPTLVVVAAYGLILPPWVLALPPRGCLNIHASLLPRWRGAAPIHRAIEAGDALTGITLMQMDAGLDTGAMLLTATEPIRWDDSTATLHDRLAVLGGRLCVAGLAAAALPATAQPEAGVSYAHKLLKAEAVIDWRAPARVIERRVRAFDPFPGASLVLDGEVVKLWRAELAEPAELAALAALAEPAQGQPGAVPGQVLRADGGRLVLACGDGALALLQLQRPGGRRIGTDAFLQQHPGLVGRVLASAQRP